MSNTPAKNKGGRPTKFTATTRKTLLDALSIGHTYADACTLAGLAYGTFREWMIEGEKDNKDGKDTEKGKFYDAVTRSNLSAADIALSKWVGHFEKDYRACRDFLARRFPDKWGNQERKPIEPKNLDALSDEELEKLARGEDG